MVWVGGVQVLVSWTVLPQSGSLSSCYRKFPLYMSTIFKGKMRIGDIYTFECWINQKNLVFLFHYFKNLIFILTTQNLKRFQNENGSFQFPNAFPENGNTKLMHRNCPRVGRNLFHCWVTMGITTSACSLCQTFLGTSTLKTLPSPLTDFQGLLWPIVSSQGRIF